MIPLVTKNAPPPLSPELSGLRMDLHKLAMECAVKLQRCRAAGQLSPAAHLATAHASLTQAAASFEQTRDERVLQLNAGT